MAVDKTTSHVCGSDAGFLRELATSTSVTVPYEWAPLVPGTLSGRPTVGEPKFLTSGKITKWYPPNKDLRFSHPFGLDYSMNIDMAPSSLYALNLTGQRMPYMHSEIESGLFPYDALGWGQPRVGDSVALKGDWILDCGHPGKITTDPDVPGYGSEIHPPTFLAFARSPDRLSTESMAFGNPYRPTQLFNGKNENLANDFQHFQRFTDPATGTFAQSLDGELHDFTAHIGIHQLIEDTDLGTVIWDVCAPGPKPAGGTLAYGYQFTARPGIHVSANAGGSGAQSNGGCVEFTVQQTADYAPAIPARQSVEWPWADINQSFKDTGMSSTKTIQNIIHDKICEKFCACPPLCKSSNNPFVDSYQPLGVPPQPAPFLGDRVMNENSAVVFPFYGRVHVEWIQGRTPVVIGIAPNRGGENGNEKVVIRGTGLTGATGVFFGTTAASSFTVDSDTQVRAVSPPGTQGTTVDVKVKTPGGMSAASRADQFTYLIP